MKLLKYDEKKCTLCKLCLEKCPFAALTMEENGISVGETCKMCGVCVKVCPENALTFEQKAGSADKIEWRDILIYGELTAGNAELCALHPVVLELIGEAQKLAAKVDYRVKVVLVGAPGNGATPGPAKIAETLLPYGVDEVFVYEHEGFAGFKVDCYTDAVSDCIARMKPSVVLVGATAQGRSLAPRLATRFHTGLTADCTQLDIRANSDLVQTRPAFGGNIMARILIQDARPQFATVRYKVMDRAQKLSDGGAGAAPKGRITRCAATDEMARSRIAVLKQEVLPREKSIEEEDVLLVAGRGAAQETVLASLEKLASLLGGQLCFTRPMVEAGHGDTAHQIGLSGRTVKPSLIITFGVSGAIQFTAAMKGSGTIIAVNSDPAAQIFSVADYRIVEKVEDFVPELLAQVAEARGLSALGAGVSALGAGKDEVQGGRP